MPKQNFLLQPQDFFKSLESRGMIQIIKFFLSENKKHIFAEWMTPIS